jgi:MFS family permease
MKNPLQQYLAQVWQANWRYGLLGLLIVLTVSLALIFLRTTPFMQELLSERMLMEFVIDLPVKSSVIVLPFVLFYRGKMYAAWVAENPNIHISKKDFSTGTYLSIFLASLLGLPILIAVFVISSIVDPNTTERILTNGIFNTGAMVFFICVMAAIVYTLQFAKFMQKKQGAFFQMEIAALPSILLAAGLQALIQLTLTEQSYIFHTVVIVLMGFVVLLIGRVLTARKYEKMDSQQEKIS